MDLIQQGLNNYVHSTNYLVNIVQSHLDNVTLDEATVKLGPGVDTVTTWTCISHETSVLIPPSTEEMRFSEQPFLTTIIYLSAFGWLW